MIYSISGSDFFWLQKQTSWGAIKDVSLIGLQDSDWIFKGSGSDAFFGFGFIGIQINHFKIEVD